ncbi:hypothetical protein AVEN_255786-1 [Araneus ventricosus]|uniref:Uncharacterized protein n=1 Tax=Araneus ventricosus TaxID=182803 RepID=A0A4Y2QBX1_ARAVE|nr:hypothetical protein AVEN_255786-1 [Araneus ventricosus]
MILWETKWDKGERYRSFYKVLLKVKITPSHWKRSDIILVTGHVPLPTYRKRVIIRRLGKPPTLCYKLPVYNLIPPINLVVDLETLWWKRVLNNNISWANIRELIRFIAGNEAILFPKDVDSN